VTGDASGVPGEPKAAGSYPDPRGAVHRRRKRKLRRRLLWTGIVFATVLLVLVAAVLIDASVLNGKISRVVVHNLVTAPKKGPDQGTENILLVGDTSRCALKVQNAAYGLCSQGVTGVNSDVVMILHLNPNIPSASILSIPRDLFIPNARSTGANKIDAALVEGPSQLVAAIEEDFGIPIQHYVELNFDSFAGVVNALGGVKMYFPMPLFDAESGLNITTPGCHDLNGIEALQVVRARHLQYDPPGLSESTPQSDWPQDPESDLSRIRRDHEFLRVLATAVSKRGLDNPFTDQQLVSSVVSQLQVDSGFSFSHMVNLLLTFHQVNIDNAPQLTLPVMVVNSLSYQYEGYNYGNIEFPNEQLDLATIDRVLDIGVGTDAMTGGPLPAPSSFSVAVDNGSGVPGQGAATATQLQALGMHVVSIGSTQPVGPLAETVVYYSKAQYEPDASLVARKMSGAVVMALGPTTPGSDVTVVTGSDFTVNRPPAPAPTTTTTAASGGSTTTLPPTTTTTGVPPALSGEIDPPSASNEPLAPFDPRSCSASGGAGP
jgi:LCP family protein required for cell wall assembly